MPPRKGIVKSGNAGNSSKPVSTRTDVTKSEEKPLFPSGFKYPLSLLHERCQANGWDKPSVDTRKCGNAYSFSVTLSRTSKKTSEKETVRLHPDPPYTRPTAIEARHWGATYALYRFCNGIQLNRVLPPGPREYWNELAEEKKKAPDHQMWMYEADPFAARKMVDERQAKAAAKREEARKPVGERSDRPSTISEFTYAPEVKMATPLRDSVEQSIKKAVAMYPEAQESMPLILAPEDVPALQKQLTQGGFTPIQARNATTALSQASALTSNLLANQTPLQACIEYLILHIPECDLPKRFLPDVNSSNPFVTSAHSGTEDLKLRWLQEKAVKECGWPIQVIKECVSSNKVSDNWPLLVKLLNKRLLGEDINGVSDPFKYDGELEELDQYELEALEIQISANNELIVLSPMVPMKLVVLLDERRLVPTVGDPPPMYISSTTVAAYVRLHILSKLLSAFKEGTFADSGESFVMAAIRHIEEEWARIEDHGPPDMSTVLQHLLPQEAGIISIDDSEKGAAAISNAGSIRKRRPRKLRDDRSDARVKEDFEALRKTEKYAQMLSARKRLPAFQAQAHFLRLLAKNQCVVVVGETGCGKTTQLPQFILDSMVLNEQGSRTSIIITQPRRLSALGVAARVSSERLDDGSVGYAIRGESKQSNKTKLLFCTTGVVLRRLASGDKLQDVTHVVVDEVHERSVDGDLLLLQLKELMKQHKNLKVILMSATINHEIFIKYFNNAPLLTILGYAHPVSDLYLEDVLPRISYRPTSGKGGKRISENEKEKDRSRYSGLGLDDDCIAALQTITRSDRIDYELVAAVVEHIVSTAEKIGGILIFLPGVQEIRQCMESLRKIRQAKILPLHANLSNEEQRAVFASTPNWKIVCATNVAETSITIDDIIYVVDCGKVKETQFDPESGLTKLVEQWVTRAAAKQRRGRAGRTQSGFCYKMYTRKQEEHFGAFPIPEIKRVPLESVSLTVKILHKDVKAFLNRALDPPDMAAMDHALAVLQQLGAVDQSDEVTPLGEHLATLPLDLRLGKMLILATIFQCLNPILTVAACVSSKPLFLSPHDKRVEASRARERFTTANSDLLTDANAYAECLRLRNEGASQGAIRSFCEENFISASTVRDITSLRNDLFSALSSLDFVPPSSTPTSDSLNVNSDNTNLVKAVILGGLWPRVARVHLPKSAIKFDKVQAGTVQRENTAKQFKFYDISRSGERVFLHPASILFGSSIWKSPFVAYFQKQMTTKIFLRDATEVPMYALLLFGGPVSVNHIGGGLTVGTGDGFIKLKAWPRIGVLVNHLRRLLDVQLARCVEDSTTLTSGSDNPVTQAMLALLTNDGLSHN